MAKIFVTWIALFALLLQQVSANEWLVNMHQHGNITLTTTQTMAMPVDMPDCHNTQTIDHTDIPCCDMGDCNHCCASLSALIINSYNIPHAGLSVLAESKLADMLAMHQQLPFRPPIIA